MQYWPPYFHLLQQKKETLQLCLWQAVGGYTIKYHKNGSKTSQVFEVFVTKPTKGNTK